MLQSSHRKLRIAEWDTRHTCSIHQSVVDLPGCAGFSNEMKHHWNNNICLSDLLVFFYVVCILFTRTVFMCIERLSVLYVVERISFFCHTFKVDTWLRWSCATKLNTAFDKQQRTRSFGYIGFHYIFEQIQREIPNTWHMDEGSKIIEISWQLLHLCQNGGHKKNKRQKIKSSITTTTRLKMTSTTNEGKLKKNSEIIP